MHYPRALQPISILMYHQVDAVAARGSPLRGLTVSPTAFARQMGLLKALGYRGLSMVELAPYLRGERQGKVVGLSFDDGYLNNLEHALPVLQRYGFSATCYAVSNALGGSNHWDHAKGMAPKALMNAQQMRAWIAAGQDIGAHSCDHVDLGTLPDAAAEQQIALCKLQLEAALDAPVRHFCYPYGHYKDQHVAMVRAAGYATATTTRRGRCAVPLAAVGPQPTAAQLDANGQGASTALFELPRVPVWRATSLAALWLKLATGYEDRKASRP